MAGKKNMISRGYNLSAENVMWLVNLALIATVKKKRGTVSASAVMDRILTEAREKDEKVNGVFSLEKVKG